MRPCFNRAQGRSAQPGVGFVLQKVGRRGRSGAKLSSMGSRNERVPSLKGHLGRR